MSTEPKLRRAKARDGLVRIGLVGRAGSGKSTVARALVEDGARLIDADRLGHEVTDRDPEVRKALEAEYGPDIYHPDGTLDRPCVAARIFADREARSRLDALVHPRILERIRREWDALRDAGFRGVAVIDAALMLEWGLERDCDAVIAVVAPEAMQIERLWRSRGWSEADARARLQAQRTNEAFAAAADVTLVNQGSAEELRRQARAAVASIAAASMKGTEC